jgi:nucleotide-binding universal stress UspA family protein
LAVANRGICSGATDADRYSCAGFGAREAFQYEAGRGTRIAIVAIAVVARNFMTFKKILCPIDFDENSIAALDSAAELARESGAIVEVLHVVPINMQPGAGQIYIDVYSAQQEAAQAKLAEIAKTHLAGVKCELRVTVAQPAVAILHAQKAGRADVIVMSTHGRRGLAHLFLGSVAEHVVREAPCPVLTFRSPLGAEHPASGRA